MPVILSDDRGRQIILKMFLRTLQAVCAGVPAVYFLHGPVWVDINSPKPFNPSFFQMYWQL